MLWVLSKKEYTILPTVPGTLWTLNKSWPNLNISMENKNFLKRSHVGTIKKSPHPGVFQRQAFCRTAIRTFIGDLHQSTIPEVISSRWMNHLSGYFNEEEPWKEHFLPPCKPGSRLSCTSWLKREAKMGKCSVWLSLFSDSSLNSCAYINILYIWNAHTNAHRWGEHMYTHGHRHMYTKRRPLLMTMENI